MNQDSLKLETFEKEQIMEEEESSIHSLDVQEYTNEEENKVEES